MAISSQCKVAQNHFRKNITEKLDNLKNPLFRASSRTIKYANLSEHYKKHSLHHDNIKQTTTMKNFAVLFLCISTAFAGVLPSDGITRAVPMKDIENRIIDGSPATVGQFPWQAALILKLPIGQAFCGGSLIGTKTILTAAHCVLGVETVTAYLGVTNLNDTSGRVTVPVQAVGVHSGFSFITIANDIAILNLTTTVSTSSRVAIIPLATSALGSGVFVTVSGWGRTSDLSLSTSNTLNYVDLFTITNAVCRNTYYGGTTIRNGMVCTFGSGNSCQGDSGGPLITGSGSSAVQVGIVSFGSILGCEAGIPSVYTRVASYRDWIRTHSGV